MSINTLEPVPTEAIRRHVLSAFQTYFPNHLERLKALPIPKYPFPSINTPLRLVMVSLPVWGASHGVQGEIAVPREACLQPDQPSWQTVDWWLAAFLLLEGWHERAWEQKHGPIHSYSLRLKGWDGRAWDRAWVNRIALFLRAWVANRADETEEHVFGLRPVARFLLTHDVDAVTKTLPIRLKQGVFNLFNAGRGLAGGEVGRTTTCIKQATRFFFGREDWWTLDHLVNQERRMGIHSRFHISGGSGSKTPKNWLLDPSYSTDSPRLVTFLRAILREGWSVGLHPTFDTWQDPEQIEDQRRHLESVLGGRVSACRQHWLRFSWSQTWTAQEAAGLRDDTTLMFNDRPGFRNAAALQWHPWNPEIQSARSLQALPTIFMDSHFYDYRSMTDSERKVDMVHWLDEIRAVGGEGALLWHPHTLTEDYGWQPGFDDLLEALDERIP